MPVDCDTFRQVMSSFPTGVTVVTVAGLDGEPFGLTCNAFSAVSTDPPLLLVCVDRTSRTLPHLVGARSFVVNFLGEDAADAARLFASKDEGKFASVQWSRSDVADGAPILAGVSAYAECTIRDTLELGDHVVFVGLVESGRVDPSVAPLIYHRRALVSAARLAVA
jgi:flavin reductase (DIM6/NTAB) family NADH-FMN oxidoreductase RutF